MQVNQLLTDNFVDIVGASFISIIRNQLPRLLRAVAPAGVGPRENYEQCAKVLSTDINIE